MKVLVFSETPYQYLYIVLYMFYYRYACAIPAMDSVILTGGWYNTDRVSRYGLAGHLSDLAPLVVGRYMHGCGGYYRQDTGTQVGRICVLGINFK